MQLRISRNNSAISTSLTRIVVIVSMVFMSKFLVSIRAAHLSSSSLSSLSISKRRSFVLRVVPFTKYSLNSNQRTTAFLSSGLSNSRQTTVQSTRYTTRSTTKHIQSSSLSVRKKAKHLLRRSSLSLSSSQFSSSDSSASYSSYILEDTFNKMKIHHYPIIDSTQDEARRLLKGTSCDYINNKATIPSNTPFVISSNEQTKGRGTSGRSWIGPRGNTFLTIAFPSDDLCGLLPTLLPLKIGCIVANRIQGILDVCHENNNNNNNNNTNEEEKAESSSTSTNAIQVRLKWPNDTLIENKKISGVLIESETSLDNNGRTTYWFLVGIGVNWRVAPDVDDTGPNYGRETTCICEYCPKDYTYESSNTDNDDDDDDEEDNDDKQAKQLGFDIAKDINIWLQSLQQQDSQPSSSSSSSAQTSMIVQEWERWTDFGKKQKLRDVPGNEVVTPLGLELDGRLRVRGRDGLERLLCTEYLF